MNWSLVLDFLALVALGILGVFALVAYATKGVRLRALPRGVRPVTQAELDEAHDRAWREDLAVEAMRRGGAR